MDIREISKELDEIDAMINVIEALHKYKDKQHIDIVNKTLLILKSRLENMKKECKNHKDSLNKKKNPKLTIQMLEDKFNTEIL